MRTEWGELRRRPGGWTFCCRGRASCARGSPMRATAAWPARTAGRACGVCRRRAASDAGIPARAMRVAWCETLPPYVRAARSYCWVPGGTGGGIVHALKYGGWRATATRWAV